MWQQICPKFHWAFIRAMIYITTSEIQPSTGRSHRSPSYLADIHDSILACCYQWGIYSLLSFTAAEMNNQLVWQRTGPMVIRVLVSDRNFKVRCTFWFQEHSDVWRRSHGDVCGQGAGWFEISWPWNNQHLNVTISLPWGHNEHDDV